MAGEDGARLNHEVQRILLNYGSQVLGAIPNPRQSADVYHELRRGLTSTDEATLAHYQTTELHVNAFMQIAMREPHHDDWDAQRGWSAISCLFFGWIMVDS